MSQIRTFIEVAIPDTKPLVPLMDALRDIPGIRASPMSQLHITLAFIGDVDERRIPRITECVKTAIEGIEPFGITIGGTGRFPTRGSPRVIWIGAKPSDRLCGLADAVRKGLDKAKVDYDDKPFKPHITIGRCNGPSDVDSFLTSNGEDMLSFDCDEIRVMGSELTPKGAKHRILSRITL